MPVTPGAAAIVLSISELAETIGNFLDSPQPIMTFSDKPPTIRDSDHHILDQSRPAQQRIDTRAFALALAATGS